MIFGPFVSIPADEVSTEDAPKTHLVTKKDIKRTIIVLIVLILFIGIPGYRYMKKISDWHVCAGNLNSIYKAISLYAADHDDRFPPIASCDPSTGTPYVTSGKVRTWASVVFSYDPRAEIYRCPASDDKETVPTEAAIEDKQGNWTDVPMNSSYGMYAPYSAANSTLVERASQVAFIGETSNFGADNSYDPFPFKDSSGQIVPFDGFSIGWDNSNVRPTAASKSVTRVALRGSSMGTFEISQTRHDKGDRFITPDGNLITIGPNDARITMRGGEPSGLWQAPAVAP